MTASTLGSRTVTEASYRAAAMAGYAPSVHNRQPWRWILRSESLDLHLERSRLAGIADRHDRLALMSCGAALHHARVGLAAYGWAVTVEFPPAGAADHVARVHIDGVAPHDLNAVRLTQLMRLRRTDRQPADGRAPAEEDLAAVSEAVAARHTSLHRLTIEQLLVLATARPAEPPDQLSIELEETAASTFVVLHGAGDRPADWVRAGEALCAGWLVATGRGLSVLPLSAPVVDTSVAQAIRAVLTGAGQPYLVVRLLRHGGDRVRPRLPERQLISSGTTPAGSTDR